MFVLFFKNATIWSIQQLDQSVDSVQFLADKNMAIILRCSIKVVSLLWQGGNSLCWLEYGAQVWEGTVEDRAEEAF